MNKLWAPWRMAYINTPSRGGCFLCEAWRNDDLAEDRVVHKGVAVFAIMNIYPYTNGHLLVAPARHVARLEELTADESGELMTETTRMVALLQAVFAPQGFNIGMNLGRVAGAGLEDHLHLHVVPRWSGDTNFMPLCAETKVISEHLDETYSRLRAGLSGGVS